MATAAGPSETTILGIVNNAATRNECELTTIDCPVNSLRVALAREDALLRQKDELIQQLEVLRTESDHRLLNSIQMVVSLLSLQSRACTDPGVASKLDAAAARIATIQRVHRRLHSLDGLPTVAFRRYLEDLCHDYSEILFSEDGSERFISVEGVEINLPRATSMPLGFIANELIMNAAKHGKGRIQVTLETHPKGGNAVSIFNDGPALPEKFDPSASQGLGMKIIQCLVKQIGGELRFGHGHDNQGAKFVVLFG